MLEDRGVLDSAISGQDEIDRKLEAGQEERELEAGLDTPREKERPRRNPAAPEEDEEAKAVKKGLEAQVAESKAEAGLAELREESRKQGMPSFGSDPA